jgi:hypothetical protein
VMFEYMSAAKNQCGALPFNYGRITLTFGNCVGDRTSGLGGGLSGGLGARR